MFRELIRKKQQLSQEECIRILRQEPRGVLSVQGDDGYPYGLPTNHWYNEGDGCLYFHGSRKGHKMDSLNRCSKVSFCVYDQGYRREGEWALNIKSVIVFGRVELLTDHSQALEMVRRLSGKYTQDTAYIEKEIEAFGRHVQVFRLIPEHITGKLVNES